MPIRVYECDASELKLLKKMLEYDPYLDQALNEEALKKLAGDKLANVIFTRQEYELKEGRAIGAEENKSYLYLKATDEFLDLAEERFKKDFKTVKRATPDAEKKFITTKEEEEAKANSGFGAIFGG